MEKPEKKIIDYFVISDCTECGCSNDDSDKSYNQACEEWEKYHIQEMEFVGAGIIRREQRLPSEEEIRTILQDCCIGRCIPCKNPQTLTIEELKNGLKIFEVRGAKAISKRIREE